jgi:hypothetical protein
MSHEYDECYLCGATILIYATCDDEVTATRFKGRWICASCIKKLRGEPDEEG